MPRYACLFQNTVYRPVYFPCIMKDLTLKYSIYCITLCQPYFTRHLVRHSLFKFVYVLQEPTFFFLQWLTMESHSCVKICRGFLLSNEVTLCTGPTPPPPFPPQPQVFRPPGLYNFFLLLKYHFMTYL